MTNRNEELRRALVASVDAAPYARPRRRGILVAAGIAAFAIAGSVTGLAAATAATARSGSTPDETTVLWVLSYARAGTQQLGPLQHVETTGNSELELGQAPEGATGYIALVSCTTAGTVNQLIDGERFGSVGCDSDSLGGGGGGVLPLPGPGDHVLGFEADDGMAYQAWAMWVNEPPLPEESLQQKQEMSDGVVTRAEYAAAFNRFLGCMAAGGHDIGGTQQRDDSVLFSYAIPEAAHSDGTDDTCYAREFREVDSTWQISQE